VIHKPNPKEQSMAQGQVEDGEELDVNETMPLCSLRLQSLWLWCAEQGHK